MAEIIQNISNLLTPLNMLPNSDFLASDTLPIVLDIGHMNGNEVELCKNWTLKGRAENVKVFIVSNRITIECTHADEMYLISNELKLIQGRAYTSIASLTEENGSLNSWELSLPEYATTKYSRKDKEKRVDIFTLENNNSFKYSISLNFCNTKLTKAVSIYDMALYEGSFTNPPVRQSTDSFLSDVIGSQHIEQEITEVRNDISDLQTHVNGIEDELHAFETSTNTSINDLDTRKQDKLTFDDTPTSGSDNPVKSYGIYTYVNTKTSNLQTKLTFDSTPTASSNNPVTSKGIYSFVNTKTNGLQTKLTFDSEPKSGSSNPVTSGGVYSYVGSVSSAIYNIMPYAETWDDSSYSYNAKYWRRLFPAAHGVSNYIEAGVRLPVKNGGLYVMTLDFGQGLQDLVMYHPITIDVTGLKQDDSYYRRVDVDNCIIECSRGDEVRGIDIQIRNSTFDGEVNIKVSGFGSWIF